MLKKLLDEIEASGAMEIRRFEPNGLPKTSCALCILVYKNRMHLDRKADISIAALWR